MNGVKCKYQSPILRNVNVFIDPHKCLCIDSDDINIFDNVKLCKYINSIWEIGHSPTGDLDIGIESCNSNKLNYRIVKNGLQMFS